MKYFILFLFVLVSTSGFSTIWRVNNTGGVVADFTAAQAAHDGATAGDTLMFEPSPTSYGVLTVTKKLTIFGVGYFHANSNPNTPINASSSLSTLTFNSGSSGSLVTGMYFNTSTGINTSNITVSGNYGAGQSINVATAVSNIVIVRNYFVTVNVGGTASNVFISNNYLDGINVPATSVGVVVSYNVVNGSFSCIGQSINNNIVIGGSSFNFSSSTVLNNIDARVTPSQVFGTSNGNFGNVSPLNVFAGGSVSGTTFNFTYDGDLKLKALSPAIGAAIGGEDCGMYGGSSPYKLSGLPPIPQLTKFSSTGIGSDTTPVQITISAKSSN